MKFRSDLLEKIRIDRCLDKTEMAKAIGVSDATYRKMASGELPKMKVLRRVAEAMNIEPTILIDR